MVKKRSSVMTILTMVRLSEMITFSSTSTMTMNNYIIMNQPWAIPLTCHTHQMPHHLLVAIIIINMLNSDLNLSPKTIIKYLVPIIIHDNHNNIIVMAMVITLSKLVTSSLQFLC